MQLIELHMRSSFEGRGGVYLKARESFHFPVSLLVFVKQKKIEIRRKEER